MPSASRKNKSLWLAIGISLLGGASTPLVFFLLKEFCGNSCQRSYIEYKTQIDFGTAILLFGLDKAYIHYQAQDKKVKRGNLLLPICITLLALLIIGIITGINSKAQSKESLIVLAGIAGGCAFAAARAKTLVFDGYSSYNRITLLMYSIPIMLIPLGTYSVEGMLTAIAISWIGILPLIAFKNSSRKNYPIFDKKTLSRDIKYGFSEIGTSLGILAPAYIAVNVFRYNDPPDAQTINSIGLIIILANLVRFPISTLIPIILKENFSIKRQHLLAMILICIGAGLTSSIIHSIYLYKTLQPNPFIGTYISLCCASYFIAVLLYKNGKSLTIFTSATLATIALISLPHLTASTMNHETAMILLIICEAIKILSMLPAKLKILGKQPARTGNED
jgi:hypothetical protein